MRLFIPACGDRLTLAAPWTFHLYLEHRNIKFAKERGLIDKDAKVWSLWEDDGIGARVGRRRFRHGEVTLDAGTVIECDRVYIRSFNKSKVKVEDDFDSVTWKVLGKNGKPARNQRFWVKLSSCNGLEYELADDAIYRDRVKLIKEVMES